MACLSDTYCYNAIGLKMNESKNEQKHRGIQIIQVDMVVVEL